VSAAPPVTPAAPSPLLKAATDTLKLVVGMAASPGGLALATSLLGAANPAILLIEQFGLRLLGPALAIWSLPDVDEATLTAHLAATGYKVEPFDPMTGFK
jgi:hypothetical protein